MPGVLTGLLTSRQQSSWCSFSSLTLEGSGVIPGAESPCTVQLQSSGATAREKAQPQSDRRPSPAAPEEGRGHKGTTDKDHVCSRVLSNPEKLYNVTADWALTQLRG